MTANNSLNHRQPRGIDTLTANKLIVQLRQFDSSTEQFLTNLLAVQRFLASADSAAVLRDDHDKDIVVSAIYPPY